tara:strand:+ start:92 stop:616 length:525 start_codon:yes stop_codon:yes gene_type:complete
MYTRSKDRKILIGKLGKPHGLRGSCFVHYYGEDPLSLKQYKKVFLNTGETLEVDKVSYVKDRSIVNFVGIESRDLVELLREKEIFIEETALPKLKEGEFYHYELKGMDVENLEKIYLGCVSNVMLTGANDVLVVRYIKNNIKKERLIPYVMNNVIKNIDKEENLILVDWSEDFS